MARIEDDRLPARVRDLLAPVAEEFGAVVLEAHVKGQAGRRLVRVVVDREELDPEAGLDIDTIARLSRRCGEVLDRDDVIPGAYTLEITSPGADRPLRSPRDFARNVGRQVRVVREERCGAPRELTGVVGGVTEDEITLERDGGEVRVALADLDHGKVVLPW